MVRALRLQDKVWFPGVVTGTERLEAYVDADLFILPSFSENFGLVVAEALGHGVPVITTMGTPWNGLIENRCGWWVEISAMGLAEAIRAAISLSDSERRAMGQRGRTYIAREFSLERTASRLLTAYNWLMGVGERPLWIGE